MLITFSSSSDADVLMFGAVARHILQIIGKDPADATGIITVEQIPAAISALHAAIKQEAAHPEEADAPSPGDRDEAPEEVISLARRSAPLLQMLTRAQGDKVPVTWKG